MEYIYKVLLSYDEENKLNLIWSPELNKNFLEQISDRAKANFFLLETELSEKIVIYLAETNCNQSTFLGSLPDKNKQNLLALQESHQVWFDVAVKINRASPGCFEKHLPKVGVVAVVIGQLAQQVFTMVSSQLLSDSESANYTIGTIISICSLIMNMMYYVFSNGYKNMADMGRFFDSLCKKKSVNIEVTPSDDEQGLLQSQAHLVFKKNVPTLLMERKIALGILSVFAVIVTIAGFITYFQSIISVSNQVNAKSNATVFNAELILGTAIVNIIMGIFNALVYRVSFSLQTTQPLAELLNKCSCRKQKPETETELSNTFLIGSGKGSG